VTTVNRLERSVDGEAMGRLNLSFRAVCTPCGPSLKAGRRDYARKARMVNGIERLYSLYTLMFGHIGIGS